MTNAWKVVETADYGEDSTYRLQVETTEGADGLGFCREIVINYGETKEYAATDARDWEIAHLVKAAPAILSELERTSFELGQLCQAEKDETKADMLRRWLRGVDSAIAQAKGEA